MLCGLMASSSHVEKIQIFREIFTKKVSKGYFLHRLLHKCKKNTDNLFDYQCFH